MKEMSLASREKDFEKAAALRDKHYALKYLKDVAIGLKDEFFVSSKILFKRVEAYDISNILGLYAVGAMAVFEFGKKSLSQYRKFKIKTVAGADDLRMLREVIIRRVRNDWPKPDLILIDGGANQLRAVKRVLENYQNSAICRWSQFPRVKKGTETNFIFMTPLLQNI